MMTLASHPAGVRTLKHVLRAIALTALATACGETEPPVRQPIEECKPDQTRPQRCGINGSGTQQQMCEDGRWRDTGACDDPDVCVFGRTSTRACGPGGSGVMATYCLDGQWVDDSPCEGGDVCEAGETEARSCGHNDAGTLTATCVNGQWDESAGCNDPDECRNTTTQTEACGGLNGNATRIMLCQDGQWSEFGECVDHDVCANGDSDTIDCGGHNGNATQARSCVAGQWQNTGSCNDPDECRDGSAGVESCGGLNDNATQPLLCVAGQWAANGACTDPDVCVNGDARAVACGGFNGNATQAEVCTGGQWTLDGACIDPDECENNTTREAACGFDDGGVENLRCVDGAWTSASVCSVEVSSVFVGIEHACANIAGGRIGCWGRNNFGQIGLEAPDEVSRIQPLPLDLGTGVFFIDIAVGLYHSCALTSIGDIYCWGHDQNLPPDTRPTGAPTHEPAALSLPDSLASDEFFQSIGAGLLHTCGLTTAGRVFCWGSNPHGQLGVPVSLFPDEITETDFSVAGETAIALAVGHTHSCAILEADGAVKCWGNNDSGQLGDGLTVHNENADVVGIGGPDNHGATLVAVGNTHTCIVNAIDEVFCWGDNGYRQLGNSALGGISLIPVAVDITPDPDDVHIAINASLGASCVARASGDLYCWGANTGGLLGRDPSDPTATATPTLMTGAPPVLQFTYAGYTACVVSDDWRAYCWGSNYASLLSRGDSVPATHIPQMIEYPLTAP